MLISVKLIKILEVNEINQIKGKKSSIHFYLDSIDNAVTLPT